MRIGRTELGQEAIVRVIALGDRELRGCVAAISPVAVVQQGDTTCGYIGETERGERRTPLSRGGGIGTGD